MCEMARVGAAGRCIGTTWGRAVFGTVGSCLRDEDLLVSLNGGTPVGWWCCCACDCWCVCKRDGGGCCGRCCGCCASDTEGKVENEEDKGADEDRVAEAGIDEAEENTSVV
jgi:hypothetical protein